MITEVVICGLFCGTTRIANAGSNDTIDAAKLGIRAPESAQCKGRRFRIPWRLNVYWRDSRQMARITFGQLHVFPLFPRPPVLI
jgi:hypothetical protein